MNGNTSHQDIDRLCADTIRLLAVDGVQKANSGHPGMPMGMADCAYVLWSRYLKFNPEESQWMNRDRFVLSAGHGSMLLYALLHLSGFDVTLDDLRQFRQWGSRTPGHPEKGCLPGVETTTGPLGQGFANGVGMALASKIMSENLRRDDFNPIDHRVFGIVSDGDLMEGIASEAASLAGHLQLGNIIYLYDDNKITIEGDTDITFTEDVEARFRAYAWHTIRIDGHNHAEIASALKEGIEEEACPTLILAKTHIAYGSPNKQDHASSHGAPLGEEEVRLTKENLNWPLEPPFRVPQEVRKHFSLRREELKKVYQDWQERFSLWEKNHPDLARLWSKIKNKDIPDDLEVQLLSSLPDKPAATRGVGGKILQALSEIMPSLYGGSADLAPSNKTFIEKAASVSPGAFGGRNLHFGIREHGMGGILNGMSLYGGMIPYGATFLVFSDYMRPAIRLAALMEIQVIYVFTHDSIFVGEDGPTHQPVEHLAALRAIPGLTLFRPADGLETAMAWAYAVRKKDGPTALCLTRQNVPNHPRPEGFHNSLVKKGGYIISPEQNSPPEVILVASGSEVTVALESQALLRAKGKEVRVVSMPSLTLFQEQSESYRESILSDGHIPVVIVEAGIVQGWHALTRAPLLFIGMNRFGASAPYQELAEKFGFTGPAVAEMVECWLEGLA